MCSPVIFAQISNSCFGLLIWHISWKIIPCGTTFLPFFFTSCQRQCRRPTDNTWIFVCGPLTPFLFIEARKKGGNIQTPSLFPRVWMERRSPVLFFPTFVSLPSFSGISQEVISMRGTDLRHFGLQTGRSKQHLPLALRFLISKAKHPFSNLVSQWKCLKPFWDSLLSFPSLFTRVAFPSSFCEAAATTTSELWCMQGSCSSPPLLCVLSSPGAITFPAFLLLCSYIPWWWEEEKRFFLPGRWLCKRHPSKPPPFSQRREREAKRRRSQQVWPPPKRGQTSL